MDHSKEGTAYHRNRACTRDLEEEHAILSEPPPSYSHRGAINSHERDIDFGPCVMGYGTAPPAVLVQSNDRLTQQPLLWGHEAPDDTNSLTQRYQQVVFSRFVCILSFFGCCTLLNFISTSLNCVMIALNLDMPMIDFWGAQIGSLATKGSFILATFVPIVTCCCCLGIRSPRGSFFARVTFYVFTAIIGSVLFIYMIGEVILYVCAVLAYNSTVAPYCDEFTCIDSSSTVGYVYAVICINFLAIVFCLAMLIAAIYACIKDPQRKCSNEFVHMCIYTTFLIISGSVALITIMVPVSIMLSSVKGVPKLLEAYSLAVIGCSGAHLFLVFLFVSFIGPLFCILESRESPLFSSIFKYSMTFSWVISLMLFASGVLSIIIVLTFH